ncbi:MAG TPA: hypothetical protein PLW66_09680, partial [Saprospiraceae bacterium]|nr:hypothetical protein [Saprospiraceae bacterium]
HKWLHRVVSSFLYLSLAIPLIVGGKVYNSLKVVMSIKLVTVFGFLLIVGLFFSQPSHWLEIVSGLVKFGNVPVERSEDRNGNGQLDFYADQSAAAEQIVDMGLRGLVPSWE